MKKTLIATFAFLSSLGLSQAATVTVTNGLGGTSLQGVSLVSANNVVLNSTDFFVGVGRWSALTGFTPWTTIALDTVAGSPTREITGSFSTTSAAAAAFNGLQIHVFVGVLSSVPGSTATADAFIPTGTEWAVFSPTGSVLFPTASGTSSQAVALSLPSAISVVAAPAGHIGFDAGTTTGSGTTGNLYSFAPVPETSTSLLGAIGALALLRRRRN